jgi:tetratricopeptide (TPR) repeat protein
MRKLLFFSIVFLTGVSITCAFVGANPRDVLKSIASIDHLLTLIEFEAALTADPDNIRFGSEYRQAVIQADAYDRCIKFFEKLTADNPNASNAWLNLGLAYVDKIPAAGSITQVILANTAISYLSKSINLRPSWINLYCRGNSYLFWPKIFRRGPLGLADLEQVMKIQKQDKKRTYHVKAYIALGQAHWKMDDVDKAKAIWKEGAALFPDNVQLKALLAKDGDDLQEYIDDVLDPNKRVDTNLQELWTDR